MVNNDGGIAAWPVKGSFVGAGLSVAYLYPWIDEDEPANFMQALTYLFVSWKDSADQQLYGNLKEKFINYFNAIRYKPFRFLTRKKVLHNPGRYSILKMNCCRLYWINCTTVRASKMYRLWLQKSLKDIMKYMSVGYWATFSMGIALPNALSVYCADQTAYHDESVLKQLHKVYPFWVVFIY